MSHHTCGKCGSGKIEINTGNCIDCGCSGNGYGCAPASDPCTLPYYVKTPICPESNKQVLVNPILVGSFKNKYAFSMPTCGGRLRVLFDSVGDVPIGAWLWSSGYGYLTIVSFNALTGEIELENECVNATCEGQTQAAPGTPIPACTVWTLTPPICNPNGGSGSTALYPFLAVDFTAPADGNCLDITLTNVNGIAVNQTISINNGLYRVSAVKSATIITICNDGDGLTPGSSVIAQDSLGNNIVPIIIVNANPCTNPAATSGKMLVCDDNIIKPLSGTANGQVPVLDLASGEVNFRTIAVETLDCTELTACLVLDPALPPDTAYIILVTSTADFTPGQVITIGVRQFTVDSIISATEMRVVPTDGVSDVETYNAGSLVCSAGCCQQLQLELETFIEETNDKFDALEQAATSNTQEDNTVRGLIGGASNASPLATASIVNNSLTNNMVVMFAFSVTMRGTVSGAASQYADIAFRLDASINIGAPIPPTPLLSLDRTSIIPVGDTDSRWSEHLSQTGVIVLTPGQTLSLQCQPFVQYANGNAGGVNIITTQSRIAVLGVAVEV